jgi:hypothetical protein
MSKKTEENIRSSQIAFLSNKTGGVNPTLGQIVNQQVLQKLGKLGVPDGKPAVKLAPVPTSQPLPEAVKWPDHWPECPAEYDVEEWRRSLENMEYYLGKAKDEGDTKPWFHYPKVAHQYSELVFTTPDMATTLLDHNPINRHKKMRWVESLKRDFQADRWLQTHESIAINKLGDMHDGQHRADALAQSGKGWPLYVTFNVPPSGMYATDSGDRRSVNEKLALLFPDSKITQKTAALARSAMSGLNARGLRYTESELADFVIKYKEAVDWASEALKGHRSDTQAAIFKSLLWWGQEKIEPFVERLVKVKWQSENDPARALYLWIQKSKNDNRKKSYATPLSYYKKTLCAIYAYIEGKETKKLHEKKEDIFEWLPGWEIPSGSPCKGIILTPKPEETPTPEIQAS